MIKVENIDVHGWEHAIRGMRNPMSSWDSSDSTWAYDCGKCGRLRREGSCEPRKHDCSDYLIYDIGPNDMDLMHRLYKAGVEHRTYARMIMVWMDITAPIYWWKEMDRYTIGKTQISTSTMHKIHSKEFTLDDFSCENMTVAGRHMMSGVINDLNSSRYWYNQTKSKEYWWDMIQMLPSSYNQKRTVMMSYETVFKIIKERSGHKLDEWNEFVAILKQLPYVKEIMEGE